jgi:hypothetical protein
MRPEDSSSPWDEDSAFQGRKAAKVRRITLDLKDMTSTASPFSLNARRPVLSWPNCEPYVREWIRMENKGSLGRAGLIRGKRGTESRILQGVRL